jgi:hypothetical protein
MFSKDDRVFGVESFESFYSNSWRGKGVPEPKELVAQKHPEKKENPLGKSASVMEKAHVWIIPD